MAAKTNGISYDTIMRELKGRTFRPIYMLVGEEPYYIDCITDYVASNVLAESERDFNQSIVYGPDVTAAQVADMARRYPMMAERQVVIVKEAQAMRLLAPLTKYADKPSGQTTMLVLCYKKALKDMKNKEITSLMASIEKCGGVVFESKKVKDRDLFYFIEGYLRERNAAILPKANQMIAEHIGTDLSRLASELDKVLISMGDTDRTITPEIVEREIGVSKEFNVYELQSAIVDKNVFKANQIVNYFKKNKKDANLFLVINTLFGFFQNLMLAYYAPNKSNERDLAAYLELRQSWGGRDYQTAMRNYSAKKTVAIISKLRETDAKGKGLENLNTPNGELLQELIFFILH